MKQRLLKVMAPMAGLALVTMPALVVAPAVAPANTACAGGICNICPVVAESLAMAGAQIYCIA